MNEPNPPHASPGSAGAGPGRQPTEDEMRAALEEEMRRITVDDVLLQTIVSLVNLGGRRGGLAAGTEAERDPAQLHTAIEAVRALLPLVEARHGEALAPIKDALAQLQMAYAQISREGGQPAAEQPARAQDGQSGDQPPPADRPAGAGPAQSSGRLWVPGD